MASLTNLSSALSAQLDARTSDCALIQLGSDDSPVAGSAQVFQYYPESLSDTKAVNYQQKEIFGGSLPLYQFVAGGERVISFTATFTCDVDLLAADDNSAGNGTFARLKAAGMQRRNPDIRSAITWLRRFILPSYDVSADIAVSSTPLVYAPSKLILSLPGTGIGFAGGDDGLSGEDSVPCIMTQCDVTYDALFPSGLPRLVTVQLAFAQIGQLKGQVTFPSRTAQMDAQFNGKGSFVGYNFPPKGKRVTFRSGT